MSAEQVRGECRLTWGAMGVHSLLSFGQKERKRCRVRGAWRRSKSRRLGVHIAFQLSGHSRHGRTAFTLTSQLRATARAVSTNPFHLVLSSAFSPPPPSSTNLLLLSFFFFVLFKCLHKRSTRVVAELICQSARISL